MNWTLRERELVEALKKNSTVFGDLSPEEEAVFQKVGKKNCDYRSNDGYLKTADCASHFCPAYTCPIAASFTVPEEPKFKAGDWVMRKDGGICKPHNVYRVQIQDPRWANEDSEYLILCPPEPTPEKIPGYRVKGFRPPKANELLWNHDRMCMDMAIKDFESPRYILEKIEEPKSADTTLQQRVCKKCGNSTNQTYCEDCGATTLYKKPEEPASRWIECEVTQSDDWEYFQVFTMPDGEQWDVDKAFSVHGFAGMQYENDPNWYMSPKVFDEGGSRDECDDGCHTRRIRKVRFEKSAVEGK